VLPDLTIEATVGWLCGGRGRDLREESDCCAGVIQPTAECSGRVEVIISFLE